MDKTLIFAIVCCVAVLNITITIFLGKAAFAKQSKYSCYANSYNNEPWMGDPEVDPIPKGYDNMSEYFKQTL